MLRHVVIFSWSPEVDHRHIARVGEGLDRLAATLPSIRSYRHGRDLGLADTNSDYAIVADFDDADGFVAYRDHPNHRAFIAELITGHVAARAAVQFDFAG
jgi:Stress responsive A/B Barrel Domain